MKRLVVGALFVVGAAAPVAAQEGPLAAHVYAGYMLFGRLFATANGVAYSLDDGLLYGGQVGLRLSPNIRAIANLGYAKSSFTLKNVPAAGGGTRDIADELGLLLYDAGVQIRLPFLPRRLAARLAPLMQLGAGAITYAFDGDELRGAGATRVQGNVGVGADLQLASAVGLRVMAKDYVTALHWNDDGALFRDVKKSGPVAHNVAITAGVDIGF
jgi:hypothetical protein